MNGEPARQPVVLVTTSFPTGTNVAAGIFVARLASKLASEVDMTVVVPDSTLETEHDRGAGGIVVRRFRYAPRRWQILAQGSGGIPAALRANPWLYLLIPGFLLAMGWMVARSSSKGGIVHANWAITGLIAGLAGRLRGSRVLLTVRGEDVTRAQTSRLHRAVLFAAVRLSDQVVTVSEAFRNWLIAQRAELEARVLCVPNGVDDVFVKVGDARRVGACAGVSVITVGSLIPRKGFDQLLEAFARVPVELRCELKVVGSGPLASELETRCSRLGIADRVTFAGTVEPDAIPGLLEKADLFVLTSHSEGRPNAVLEAMAAGLPVIATDIDGVRELVRAGETGLLFNDGAIDELAVAITALAGDPARRYSYGAAGVARIRELGLLWSNTARQYLQLYRQLACGRG